MGVVRQLELARRAQHPLALLAADLGSLDRDAAGQRRAHGRQRDDHAGAHVGRAAHNAQLTAAAVDPAHRQLVGVRVLLDLEHARDDDARVAPAVVLDALDVEAPPGERIGDALGGGVDFDPVVEPGDG